MSRPTLSGALAAEVLKIRSTLIPWICVLAPTVVVLMYVLQMATVGLSSEYAPTPEEAWGAFTQSVLALWALLMLPMFVALQSAFLAMLEHGNRQWKHLLALPVPRRNHYLAKGLALAGILLLASMMLVVLVPLGGWFLQFARPELNLAGSPPWGTLVVRVSAIIAAAGIMSALQLWLALRFPNFAVVVGIGMAATVAGFLIGQSQRFGPFFPWSMPLNTLGGDGERMYWIAIAGIAGGLLVGAIGLLDLLRRNPD